MAFVHKSFVSFKTGCSVKRSLTGTALIFADAMQSFLCSTRDLSHVNLFPQSWHVTTCPLWVSWQMGVLEGVWCSMEHWRVWMSCWNFWSWLISFLGFIECISRSKWLWKELDIITAICPVAKGFTHQGSLNNTILYIDFMPSLPVLEFDGQWHQPQKS